MHSVRVSTATICLDGCVAYAGNEIHVAMHRARQEGVLESCADGGRLVRVGQSDFAVPVTRCVGEHLGPRFLGKLRGRPKTVSVPRKKRTKMETETVFKEHVAAPRRARTREKCESFRNRLGPSKKEAGTETVFQDRVAAPRRARTRENCESVPKPSWRP